MTLLGIALIVWPVSWMLFGAIVMIASNETNECLRAQDAEDSARQGAIGTTMLVLGVAILMGVR